jgi:hypothetical protein
MVEGVEHFEGWAYASFNFCADVGGDNRLQLHGMHEHLT